MSDTNGNGRPEGALPMDAPQVTCPVCKGTGWGAGTDNDPRVIPGQHKCGICGGSGKV